MNHRTTCRHCGHPLSLSMVDLGAQPPCEAILTEEQFYEPEPFYPLHARVCENCWLVQLDADVSPEKIYTEYAYYSSYSESWLQHMESYTDSICTRLGLTPNHRVVEIASNDGYLLQFFADRGIPCFGIDPAANVAEKALERGIETLVSFFSTDTAEQIVKERGKADLIIANNVFGHIPDINDFLQALQQLLQEGGTITIEIPHLMRLIEGNQFDTIYHEHYCYHSLIADLKLLESQGLKLIAVEELPTHGGSIRMFIAHREDARAPDDSIERLVGIERSRGMDTPAPYQAFGEKVRQTKRNLLRFLIAAKEEGKQVVGYGAPGKGNTLLNYCGIREDFLDFVVDRNPYKHGKFLPGSRIPIRPVEAVFEAKPDFLLILPWNISDEIIRQMDGVRAWGCQFVIPIPEVRIVV
ncbi:class I SAM-dependent methyltransferase [Pirellula sp. SH-Sr6A]|uniref:class I SAM-dependent methyltransferase n=1 Tax=Pirellula sp. SH-Sr6A TaxID=1632865 RepID=UPI0021113D8B|nr:class I SAM-dependent methyltransferase [Pirellula sp. SH-Sr6A]